MRLIVQLPQRLLEISFMLVNRAIVWRIAQVA